MKLALLLLTAATSVLASLNCTTTADINMYCCPSFSSEVVKVRASEQKLLLGCAADDRTEGRWYWNYNNLYTPYTTNVTDCNLNGRPYASMTALPNCSVDYVVLRIAERAGGMGPMDPCDPNCVSNGNVPNSTYFGDS